MSGCAHFYEELAAKADFEQAEDFARQGDYDAAAGKYEQILAQHPSLGDAALFQIGMIQVSPRNQRKDYRKAREAFHRLLNNYPLSRYGRDGAVLASLIDEVLTRDEEAGRQRKQIDELEQKMISLIDEISGRDKKMGAQNKQIDQLEHQLKELEQEVGDVEKKLERMKEVDMRLKQKKKRRP